MKNTLKAMLCIVLVFAVLASLTSCAIIEALNIGERSDTSDLPSAQPGYTGGFTTGDPHSRAHIEIHWVETYEEAIDVINGLAAAGNKIPEFYIPTYDNEAVDAKYAFFVNNSGSAKLEDGKQWYERKFKAIEQIYYFGFLEKVSIETLEFGYYDQYKCISYKAVLNYSDEVDFSAGESIKYECRDDSVGRFCSFKRYSDNVEIGRLKYENIADHTMELPGNFHRDLIISLHFIGS